MRNVSDTICKENQNTNFQFFFFFFENRALCETVKKNTVESGQDTDENTEHAHFTLDT